MSGMDMLNAQRNKRKAVGNEMPTPLHRPRTTPVNLPAAEPDSKIPDASAATSEETERPTDPPAPPPENVPAITDESATKRGKAPRKGAKSDGPAALYPVTAYLEIDEDQYIRRTIDAGRYGKPKVTSASAIIRYAVQHLARHMTPEQVVAAIREAAPETTNQGRIRL